MSDFNENYWTHRYLNGQTQWDAGSITRPLQEYFEKQHDRHMKILIPGGGNGYEAEYLHQAGFENVYLLDISPLPLQSFKERNPYFPEEHLLLEDYFTLKGNFDLIVEQTFFCALHPGQRPAYAKKANELLNPGGHLVGVLFSGELNKDHPPFGGTKEEYLQYFEPYFSIQKLEPCYNSIKPRAGRELWIDLEKN